MLNILKQIKIRLVNQFYRWFKYPKIHKAMQKYHVCSVIDTINSLVYSNKSLGRFGDGEISWIFMDSKASFEKNSKLLSKCLLHVLKSSNTNFEVALPNVFYTDRSYSAKAKRFYRLFMSKEGFKILPHLDTNKQYYNTDITRIYSGHNYNSFIASYLFKQVKKIWNKKNLLIIEGEGTRLGVGNDLFSNAKSIRRIECPIQNAFESFNNILNDSLKFLNNNNKSFLTLIALGPTATVLSFYLYKKHFRAIDIGHIDIEYDWYLINAKTKVNIPNRYVNESITTGGTKVMPIHDKKYKNEIIVKIR